MLLINSAKPIVLFLSLQILCSFSLAMAQSAPTAAQVSGYEGVLKAAHIGDTDALIELVEAGDDIEVRDSSGRTPLIVAAFASNDDVIRFLADAGADMNALEFQAYDIVTIAAVANDLALLDLALELGTDSGNITSLYDGTALIAAAHLGHHKVVESLIKADAPLDHINNLHWTALIEAVVLGDGGKDHTETARLLIEAGADQTIGDSAGVTPLEHAKSRGFINMIPLFEPIEH